VILDLPHVILDLVDTLTGTTDRGTAGFGSTGVSA
jgi:dUTPase